MAENHSKYKPALGYLNRYVPGGAFVDQTWLPESKNDDLSVILSTDLWRSIS